MIFLVGGISGPIMKNVGGIFQDIFWDIFQDIFWDIFKKNLSGNFLSQISDEESQKSCQIQEDIAVHLKNRVSENAI